MKVVVCERLVEVEKAGEYAAVRHVCSPPFCVYLDTRDREMYPWSLSSGFWIAARDINFPFQEMWNNKWLDIKRESRT